MLEEQDGVHEVGTPFRGKRTRPHRPRHMHAEDENEVDPSTLEQRQSMVTVRSGFNFVATVTMQMLNKHRDEWRVATD